MTTVNLAKSNALIVGCSLSDYCGFGITKSNTPSDLVGNHSDPRSWYNIVSAQTGINIVNHSWGGISNREIIFRAGKETLHRCYDWVVVQTTSLQRQWFWRNDAPNRPCIFSGGRVYNADSTAEINAVTEVGLNLFNVYKEVERDLVSLIMLQKHCNQSGSNMLIVNGMGFLSSAKKMFPDMFALLDTSVLLNPLESWIDSQVDNADDNSHPGEQSNRIYATQIIDYLKSKTKE